MEETKQQFKQGRPPKYGQKMECRITVRLSKELGRKVEKLCEQMKLSKSELIQNLIEGEVTRTERFSASVLRGFGFSRRVAEEDIAKRMEERARKPKEVQKIRPNHKVLLSQELSHRSAQMVANTAELIEGSNRLVQINRNGHKDRNVA